jgi:hypothetical protein
LNTVDAQVRDARGDNRQQTRQLGESPHHAEAYDECDSAHNAESEKLRQKAPDVYLVSPALVSDAPALIEAHDVKFPLTAITFHDGIQDQARDAEEHR